MKKTARRYMIIISAIVILVVIAFIAAKMTIGSIMHNEQPVFIYIDHDDDIDSVCAKIEDAGQPSTMTGFKLLAKLTKYQSNIRTGRYVIDPGMTMLQLVRRLRNHEQCPVQLVVPSVHTTDKLAERLCQSLMIDSAAISKVMHNPTLQHQWGYNDTTLMAMIIPNTYEVWWDISANQLIERLHKESENFWDKTRKSKAAKLGLKPTEVVTLASIVDSETAYTPEKPTIAGLYLNRLMKGMPLQSDPTILFAIGDFTRQRVLSEDLQVESPYNTYKYAGLPPGPIRMASISAIDAVLNPLKSDYIYMCAKEDFSGSHNFAVTYSEHMANARRYQQALNQRGIRK